MIVNSGFGIDAHEIDRLKKTGHDVWLYNTGAPRFTAGVWLWTTGATRYLQWHARMPTADPYDPTDGREGDVQMFFPTAEPCPERPDIHASLLDMAEGVVDQRWLLWLAQSKGPSAKALLEKIRHETPRDWASASLSGYRKAEAIRAEIIALARRLN